MPRDDRGAVKTGRHDVSGMRRRSSIHRPPHTRFLILILRMSARRRPETKVPDSRAAQRTVAKPSGRRFVVSRPGSIPARNGILMISHLHHLEEHTQMLGVAVRPQPWASQPLVGPARQSGRAADAPNVICAWWLVAGACR